MSARQLAPGKLVSKVPCTLVKVPLPTTFHSMPAVSPDTVSLFIQIRTLWVLLGIVGTWATQLRKVAAVAGVLRTAKKVITSARGSKRIDQRRIKKLLC